MDAAVANFSGRLLPLTVVAGTTHHSGGRCAISIISISISISIGMVRPTKKKGFHFAGMNSRGKEMTLSILGGQHLGVLRQPAGQGRRPALGGSRQDHIGKSVRPGKVELQLADGAGKGVVVVVVDIVVVVVAFGRQASPPRRHDASSPTASLLLKVFVILDVLRPGH